MLHNNFDVQPRKGKWDMARAFELGKTGRLRMTVASRPGLPLKRVAEEGRRNLTHMSPIYARQMATGLSPGLNPGLNSAKMRILGQSVALCEVGKASRLTS